MTPAKIKDHEPTAVNRDPNDQTIVSGGQTGTDSEEASEEYRRQGMKVGEYNTTSGQQQQGQQQQGQQQQGSTSVDYKATQTASTVKEGAKGTFDKLKTGAKAMRKKISDPDTSIGEEYNKEKAQ